MSKELEKTFRIFNYNRLNNSQLNESLKTQRKRLSLIDNKRIAEEETLLEISLQIDAIKAVLQYREAVPV